MCLHVIRCNIYDVTRRYMELHGVTWSSGILLSALECVHLSKNNLSINSINYDNFFDKFDKFDKYDIFPKSNYYDDILVNFSKIIIFLVHLKNPFLKVLFLTVLVPLMKYFRQFVVKSEVKHTISYLHLFIVLLL
jgi:hypothetical protein